MNDIKSCLPCVLRSRTNKYLPICRHGNESLLYQDVARMWCELVVKGEIVRCGDTLANMVCACVCLHGC